MDLALGGAEATTILSSIKPLLEETKISGNCHTIMHKLGAGLSRAPGMTLSEALGENWSACGMGLMHGFVETMDFTVYQEPSLKAFDLCEEWAAGDALKSYLCHHAVGHSFYSTSEDISSAEILCTGLATDTASGACLSGVYMLTRDAMLPRTVRSMSQVMAVCTGVSHPEHCLVMLYEPTIRRWGAFGPETAFLEEKCREVSHTCASFLGRAIAAVSSDPLTEVGFCSGSIGEDGCFEGFFESVAATGRDEPRMRDDVCDRHGYCTTKP